MNRLDMCDDLARASEALLDPMLELAKTAESAAFVMTAMAVMQALAIENPAIAVWVGDLMVAQGQQVLQIGLATGSNGNEQQAMATASIH